MSRLSPGPECGTHHERWNRPMFDTKISKPARGTIRLAFFAVCALFVVGCNGGCDMDGFTEMEYPPEHYDKTVPGSGEVRLTSHAFAFIGDEIDVLAGELMGEEGLSFCVEPISESSAEICHEDSVCDNGETGCQIDLEIVDAELAPLEPNVLTATVTIAVHESLPLTFLLSDCWLHLFSDSGGSDAPAHLEAEVELFFEIDEHSELDDLQVEMGEVTLNIDDLDYGLENRGILQGCSVIDWGVQTFLDGTLRDMIVDMVDDEVGDLTDELCRTCGDGDLPCPPNSQCNDDEDNPICVYDEVDQCVQMLLGIEGMLEIDDFIDEYLPHGAEGVHLTARLADRAEANTGISLGLKMGTEPENETTCAPVHAVERPSFDPIAPAPSLQGDVDPDGNPYMFGLAIHERTIEHLLWSLWAGGGLCLQVGGDEVEMLRTNTFQVFLSSLGDIATEDGPMKIVLSPQTPPKVALGANEVDGNQVVEGLIDLMWDDLDIHMYGYVQERYARLFTLRVDLELPLALVVEDGGVLPVLGDVEGAIQNLRLLNDDLITEGQAAFEDLIPTIMDLALPELMDALNDPIELPDIEGFQPVIEEGGITAIDNNEYIGLFANLEFVGTDDDGQELRTATTRALVSDKELLFEGEGRVPRVKLRLDVGAEEGGSMVAGDEVEYLYRLGAGPWRVAGAGPELVIESPVLRMQGEHTVELRARRADDRNGRFQKLATQVEVLVDYEAPELEIWREGDSIEVRAEDSVDSREQMQMSHRYVVAGNRGAWSNWGAVEEISLANMPQGLEAVEVRVQDRAGHQSTATLDVDTTQRPATVSAESASNRDGEPRSGGCQATTSAPSAALIAVMVLLGLAFLRRRRLAGALAATALVALTMGCSSETSGEGGDDPPCGGDCGSMVCCHESDSCVEPPEPCDEYECDPGYDVVVDADGEYDEVSCMLIDTECSCQVRDPIEVGYYGSYPSIAAGDGVVALSVHNLRYGDLMVAVIDEADAEGVLDIDEWYFVDGVPEDAAVAGSPYGPRGGIVRSGPEVGTHTATAVDEAGTVHVFYRSVDDESLKYARGERDGGDWEFETTVVEDDADSGYYSEVGLRGDRLYLFYTAVTEDGDSQIRHRAIDVDLAMGEVADTAVEVLHPQVAGGEEEESGNGEEDGEAEDEFVDYPRMVGLFLQLSQTDDGEWFLSFFDNTSERAGWVREGEEGWDEPELLDELNTGPYTSARPDADGEVHVAFMDRTIPALAYVAGAEGERQLISGGIRDREAGWSETSVGHDVTLYLRDEAVDVLFHDASTHEIMRGELTADGYWELESLAGELGAGVVGRGLFVRALELGDQRVILDFAVDTTDGDNPAAYPVLKVLD